jgi:two-component system cell cycle sensor histidine kinase/response regulator CckA
LSGASDPPISGPNLNRLLAFARKLQQASTFPELLESARDEVREATGYQHVWLMVSDSEECDELRLIEVSGERRELVWDVAPLLRVQGDPFLEELLKSNAPVVIFDARTDPRTNKDMVERLQNRTLINVPLYLLDKPFGIFGVGTFGDEGCRAPGEGTLNYLVGMAGQIAVAASRLRYLEGRSRAEKERLELERRLARVQQLESLGTLAGGIAHDFNNLLTVVIASATMAERRVEDPEALGEIRSVLGAATRASELTRQLLAMSRSQELSLKPLDVNAQLGQLLQLARRVLPETIAIDFAGGRSLPPIEGDPTQIDQVFMNLFINARDAMPDGGRLTVGSELVVLGEREAEAQPWARPGRHVLVTVTDTGTGMPLEVLNRVFEPFFTTKGPRAGTGLGLAVAYGIIRQHRGMLHCHSKVGAGTSFKVYLPASEQPSAPPPPRPTRGPPHSGGERVLLAEDEDLVRAVAVRILKHAGYRVTAVTDGDAACRAAAAEPFDLVVLDVVMPGMACHEVVGRIRSLRPDVPVLLSSGYTAGAGIKTLLQETGLEFLRKPYSPDQLLRAIRSLLDEPAEGPPR